MRESAFGVEHWEHGEDIVKAFNPMQGMKAGFKAARQPTPGQGAAQAKVGQAQRKKAFGTKVNAGAQKFRAGVKAAPGAVGAGAKKAYTTPLSAQQMVTGMGNKVGAGMSALGRTAQQNPAAAGGALLGGGVGLGAGGMMTRDKKQQLR